jgi:amino acid transporter
MNTQLPYIILAIIVLLIVAALVFFVGKNKSNNRLTPLAGLAFGFILAGILFGENRILGYSLLGIGVILAVIDIVIKAKRK